MADSGPAATAKFNLQVPLQAMRKADAFAGKAITRIHTDLHSNGQKNHSTSHGL
jgi:hypothetical protein